MWGGDGDLGGFGGVKEGLVLKWGFGGGGMGFWGGGEGDFGGEMSKNMALKSELGGKWDF